MREETKFNILVYSVRIGVPVLSGLPLYCAVGGLLAFYLHAGLLALWITSAILTRGSSIMEHGIVLIVIAIFCSVVISSNRNAIRIRDLRDKAATRPVSRLESHRGISRTQACETNPGRRLVA
jgi:hypothetical protein